MTEGPPPSEWGPERPQWPRQPPQWGSQSPYWGQPPQPSPYHGPSQGGYPSHPPARRSHWLQGKWRGIPRWVWIVVLIVIALFLIGVIAAQHSDSWQQGYNYAASDPYSTNQLLQKDYDGSPEHFCRQGANWYPQQHNLDSSDFFDGCIAGTHWVQSHY
jgi:hypothetical protein